MKKANKVMAGIGFGYAALYTIALFAVIASWGIMGSAADIVPVVLVVMVVSALPGVVGLAGRKGVFAFSFVLTVIPTMVILLMVAGAESSLGAACSLILFLVPALAISLLASIVSGIYLLVRFLIDRRRSGPD